MKRYHCEYKKCECSKFSAHSKSLCFCNHAKLWHSTKSCPYNSPRECAHTPTYTHIPRIQVAIFVPEALAIPVSEYCINVESLPI